MSIFQRKIQRNRNISILWRLLYIEENSIRSVVENNPCLRIQSLYQHHDHIFFFQAKKRQKKKQDKIIIYLLYRFEVCNHCLHSKFLLCRTNKQFNHSLQSSNSFFIKFLFPCRRNKRRKLIPQLLIQIIDTIQFRLVSSTTKIQTIEWKEKGKERMIFVLI